MSNTTNPIQIIKDWLIPYLQSRDQIRREIDKIIEHDKKIEVVYKTKTRDFLLCPTFPEDLLIENHITIVTLNTKKNLQILIEKWNKFASYDDLNIYFINPFSTTEHKWVIFPYTHSKITEKSSLKIGLESLFSTVEVY